MERNKILYAASTLSHLNRFHKPYISRLKEKYDVRIMAGDPGTDPNAKNRTETGYDDSLVADDTIPFEKKIFGFRNLANLFRIRKILKKERFDRVILNTSLAAFLIRAAMIGLRHRPRVINVVHGYLFGEKETGKKARFLLLCEKMMAPLTDVILVMNREDECIANSHRLAKERVVRIAGMGVPAFPPLHRNDAVRAELGVGKDEFLCLFVGELSKRKNQILLIRGAKLLRDDGIFVKLLLVGEGNERQNLEEEAKRLGLDGDVFLPGNCSPVTPYLAAADLYLSASRSEGLAFNVMEAMNAGLPMVLSDVKGQNDLVFEHPSVLYPDNDAASLAEKIKDAIARSSVRGVGSVTYPELSEFLLERVLDTNLRWMEEASE